MILRSPREDDFGAILTLMNAYELAAYGEVTVTAARSPAGVGVRTFAPEDERRVYDALLEIWQETSDPLRTIGQ